MTTPKPEEVRELIENATTPLVFRGFLQKYISSWSPENLVKTIGDRKIPFRTLKRTYASDEPAWERKCGFKEMTLDDFLKSAESSVESMYFDYKYLHQWLKSDSDLCKSIPWAEFGFPEKAVADTTLWVGSEGAHTPCHQDTYGFNIVAQLYGIKRWLLFPPDTLSLKPTRVPYEESSIYSDINFYCPNNLDRLKAVSGCHMVELAMGDALVVPRGWWHYVQNMDTINISINVWLPHEKDDSTHVSEALTRILVAQICKDLPSETAKLLVNPNEDDLPDTPLAVLFLQLDTVVNTLLDKKRKTRRSKRQKLNEDDPLAVPQPEKVEVQHIMGNLQDYNIEHAKSMTTDELLNIVKDNINRYVDKEVSEEDDADGSTQSLCLTRALIDAFSENNVIELVKQNLIQRLSV